MIFLEDEGLEYFLLSLIATLLHVTVEIGQAKDQTAKASAAPELRTEEGGSWLNEKKTTDDVISIEDVQKQRYCFRHA